MIELYRDIYNQRVIQYNRFENSLSDIMHSIDRLVYEERNFGFQNYERRNRQYEPRQQTNHQDLRRESNNSFLNNSRNAQTLYYAEFDISRNRYMNPRARTENRPLINRLVDTFLNSFNQPVPIRPTQEQINNASITRTFSQIENPINIECPITLEPFSPNAEVTVLLGCNHVFHRNSINSWFQNNVRCPVCRYDIREYVAVSQDDDITHQDDVEDYETTNEETARHETRDASNNLSPSLTDFANMTDALLNELFQGTNNNLAFNRNSRHYFDASNDDLIFEGYFTTNY